MNKKPATLEDILKQIDDIMKQIQDINMTLSMAKAIRTIDRFCAVKDAEDIVRGGK